MIHQIEIKLPEFNRGYHLITGTIEKELSQLPQKGILHVFIQHTSAGLTINENADPSVRKDFNSFIDELIPEHHPSYTHIFEGADDIS